MFRAAAVCVAVAVAAFPPAPATAEAGSANFFMPGCRDYIASSGKDVPIRQGVCIGWVGGLFDLGLGFCAPAEATTAQAVRVVTGYLDARPSRLHERFTLLVLEALNEAWPCRK